MRISRTVLAAALCAAAAVSAVSTTAGAQPARAAAAASQFTDAELAQYGAALKKVGPLSAALNGAQPTQAQVDEMMKAVTDTGLTPDRFNAIATAAGSDPVLKARIAIASTPDSPASKGVSDAEATSFVTAMAAITAVGAGDSPTPDQQKAQQEAVKSSGLTAERFNAIATAARSDEHLRARLALAKAKLG